MPLIALIIAFLCILIGTKGSAQTTSHEGNVGKMTTFTLATIKFPSMDEVEFANKEQLAIWYKNLPISKTKEEKEILIKVCLRFAELGMFDPELERKLGYTV
jgi:hypothetical protein